MHYFINKVLALGSSLLSSKKSLHATIVCRHRGRRERGRQNCPVVQAAPNDNTSTTQDLECPVKTLSSAWNVHYYFKYFMSEVIFIF